MTSLMHSESEDINTIRQVYSGITRNDVDFVLTLMDVNTTRIEPEGFPTAGTYTGHAALRHHLQTGRSTWAEGSCEPVEFYANGNKIVVIVCIKVRLTNQTEWIDAQIADGFIIKDGLVVVFNSFASKQEAFEWAEISGNY